MVAATSIPAQHGPTCICRTCAAGHYADLLLRADYQRQELYRLADENKALRQELAIERARRLILVRDNAIAGNDQKAWSRAVADLMSLGVSIEEAA